MRELPRGDKPVCGNHKGDEHSYNQRWNPTPLRKGKVGGEQGWGCPEKRAQERSAGDQARIHTGPPDIGKDLKETYNDKLDKERKKYPLSS